NIHHGTGYWYGHDNGDKSYGPVNMLPCINNLSNNDEYGWLNFHGRWGGSKLFLAKEATASIPNTSPFLFPYTGLDSITPPWIKPAEWIESLEVENTIDISLKSDVIKIGYTDIYQDGNNIIISGFSVDYGIEFPKPLESIRIYYKNNEDVWTYLREYPLNTNELSIVLNMNSLPEDHVEIFVCDSIDTSLQFEYPLSENAHYNTFEYFRSDHITIGFDGIIITDVFPEVVKSNTLVTITGNNLGNELGTIYLEDSNGNWHRAYRINSWSNNSITFYVPDSMPKGDTVLWVYDSAGRYQTYNLTVPDDVINVSPEVVKPNILVTITGSNLGNEEGKIYLEDSNGNWHSAYRINSWSNTLITFYVPDSMPAGDYVLWVYDSARRHQTFKYLTIEGLNVSPEICKPNSLVIVTGSDFGNTNGIIYLVDSNGNWHRANRINSWSNNSITFYIPDSLPKCDAVLWVYNTGGRHQTYKYLTVEGLNVSPEICKPNSLVTVTGSDFGNTNGIIYLVDSNGNWHRAYRINSWSNNSITFYIPDSLSTCDAVLWVYNTGGRHQTYKYLKVDDSAKSLSKIAQTSIPKQFNLSQNFPNPFNAITTINFSIPNECYVNLKILNIMGEEVETLIDKKLSANNYSIIWDASSFPSGLYFYHIKTDSNVNTKKMSLVK
ncbi:IPT/TIG domain-containing protein, partial [Candidatus Latescibacterota bacterium]